MQEVAPSDEAPTTQPVTETILQKVAAREECDPTALTPSLYDCIDPDALNQLFAPLPSGTIWQNGYVEFEYCGYTITVTAGQVRVREPQDPADYQDGDAEA